MKLFQRFIRKTFLFWQSLGIHVIPVHFYEPIPDTRKLSEALWSKRLSVPGVDMNQEKQLKLLSGFVQYKEEYKDLLVTNSEFGSVDAEVLYCMVRHHAPKRIIEVGSGYSTTIMLKALEKNGTGQLISIDPYPKQFVQEISKSIFQLKKTLVQEVLLEDFQALGENDILFIDSSHVLKIGSDVQYEFLEVLPGLKHGVVVHVHDIFLPAEYPKDWVMNQHRFFNEQYLLQAFLAFNNSFEVLWGGSYMHLAFPDKLAEVFPSYNKNMDWPGSFWMKKTV